MTMCLQLVKAGANFNEESPLRVTPLSLILASGDKYMTCIFTNTNSKYKPFYIYPPLWALLDRHRRVTIKAIYVVR